MQWNIENIVMIVLKHLEMNQFSVLNNPYAIKEIHWSFIEEHH